MTPDTPRTCGCEAGNHAIPGERRAPSRPYRAASESAACRPEPAAARDIAGRHEIVRLVDAFYARVRADDLLGPIFDDVARVDWAAHLPRMYDFWDSVLFSSGTFHGNPLLVHHALAQLTPLTARAFDRWVALFLETVDDLFSGPMAAHTKRSAERIAATLQLHLGT